MGGLVWRGIIMGGGWGGQLRVSMVVRWVGGWCADVWAGGHGVDE